MKKAFLVFAVLLVLLASGWFYLLWHGRAVSRASRPLCEDNLHQIGLGMMMYIRDDPRGRFAPDLPTLFLQEQVPPAVFICPGTSATNATGDTPEQIASQLKQPGPHESYIYVGAGLTKGSPPDALALYEPLTNHRYTGSHVLFADGHVEFLQPDDVAQIIRMDRSGVRPIYWPPHPATQPSTRP